MTPLTPNQTTYIPRIHGATLSIAPGQQPSSAFAKASRPAWVDWISRNECFWALTLNPNRSLGLKTELSIVRSAFKDADQALLGPRYNQVDGRKRLLGFVFAEHVNSNLHFHIALRPGASATGEEEARRCNVLANAWQRRVVSGSTYLKAVTTTQGWVRYISKEFRQEDFECSPSSLWWPERQRLHVLDRSWAARQAPANAI